MAILQSYPPADITVKVLSAGGNESATNKIKQFLSQNQPNHFISQLVTIRIVLFFRDINFESIDSVQANNLRF